MGDLVPQSIEWIDTAPIRIEARSESTATPDDVFAVLAEHERWPEWFPSVRKVTVLGGSDGTGVGARRRVTLPGSTVEEEFIVWEPGRRWSFTGLSARPRFTRSLVEDCRLEAAEGGGTSISYTIYIDPPPALRPIVKVLARGIRTNNTKAMANLAKRAAGPTA